MDQQREKDFDRKKPPPTVPSLLPQSEDPATLSSEDRSTTADCKKVMYMRRDNCKLATDCDGFLDPSLKFLLLCLRKGGAKYQSCHRIWLEKCEGGEVKESAKSLKYSSELLEDHFCCGVMAYHMQFVTQYRDILRGTGNTGALCLGSQLGGCRRHSEGGRAGGSV